jgi:DNA excision repair protein ERCC-2
MQNNVKISVRSLVEYVYRSGSILSAFRTSTALTEGTKAHQKIQKTYTEQDQKEVYLSAEIEYDGLQYTIDGRCDGLLTNGSLITIDEIKSTVADLQFITEESYKVHWAQAKCYAYMYAREQRIDQIEVQLTYVQVITEEQKKYQVTLSLKELEQFMLEMVEGYAPYARLRLNHQQLRDQSIKDLSFPFDAYREGQRTLAGAVYKTISEGKGLFAKAPTGIGKTISTTFPSIKAISEGLLQRIYYLTAKTINRAAAEDAFLLMHSKGLHLKVVTITAKDKVCYQTGSECSKEYCAFSDGHYDRLNEAMLDMLSQESLMNRTVIERYATQYRVCPFEFSLDAAYAADAVICDYNYIFDPRISLKRQYEEQKKQTVLLVDEAHNLVDRAREMFSASLNKSDFLLLQREWKGARLGISAAAKAVNDYFILLRKQNKEHKHQMWREQPGELISILETFISHAEKELTASGNSSGISTLLLLDTYFAAQGYIRISKLYDKRFVAYAEFLKNEVTLKLYCLDPSYLLQQTSKGYRARIYFSATLSPLPYYLDMLGGGLEDQTLSIPSPFSSEQLKVYIQQVSTRFHDRERSKEPIVRLLSQLVLQRPGNYLVYFPSYVYMNDIYELFTAEHAAISTIIQSAQMSEEERESFIATFQEGTKAAYLGFAVMGGIFAESIDLVGDRLNGVVVVGVGLPQIGLERDILKDYYQADGKNGYDYAYVYPGMNKVLQAGGRLIRSETDSGSLVLVDDRYLQTQYQRLLPKEWQQFKVIRNDFSF